MPENEVESRYDDLGGEINKLSAGSPAGMRLDARIRHESTIQVRNSINKLSRSIDNYASEASVTSTRIWWLNLVLTGATVVMAVTGITTIISNNDGTLTQNLPDTSHLPPSMPAPTDSGHEHSPSGSVENGQSTTNDRTSAEITRPEPIDKSNDSPMQDSEDVSP